MRISSSWQAITLASLVVAGFGCGHKDSPGESSDGPPNSGKDSSVADSPPLVDSAGGCGLVTCQSVNAACGPIGDGCGGTIDCGSCPTGETCGGGGTLFQCGSGADMGSSTCVPQNCIAAGAECGITTNGCGGVTPDCGACGSGLICGAVTPNQCGVPPCEGPLCSQVNSCSGSGQKPTTITGTVTAPGHDDVAEFGSADPIYDALVYIPNGSAGAPTFGVTPFAPGVACDTCSNEVSGSPLTSQVTPFTGVFTLDENVPCGTDIPLVIQLGKWRRMITIPSVACCATTTLTGAQTHLPRDHQGSAGDLYSDIPLMAFDTGSVDTLHCVLRNIGVADTEFTDPGSGGRVNFFHNNGAVIDGATPSAAALVGSAGTLNNYDIALFECVGGQDEQTTADEQNVINYANVGGRVFATHFSYVWLTNENTKGSASTNTSPEPFDQTAAWQVNQGDFADGSGQSIIGNVDTTLQGDPGTQARRIAFSNWLLKVGASTTLGQIPVVVVRHDLDSISSTPATEAGAPAQQWLYADGSAAGGSFSGPLHYTFDTPVAYSPNPPPSTECGRVLFSDFHVSNASASGDTFPKECVSGPMNAQEKTLEFMLFDLASCVGPPSGVCIPKTCAQLGYSCGESGDGCDDGVVLSCGTCQTGTCGGSSPGVCGGNTCTPLTCAGVNAQCGIIGNGCGTTIDCGTCPAGETCGGGGQANQCGGGVL